MTNATPLAPERLDRIRHALATLSNPDAAYASPHTWASMLRDTVAELDRLTAALGADRPAYIVTHGELMLGHYTSREQARVHCLTEAPNAGVDPAGLHWAPLIGEDDDADIEDAPELLCWLDDGETAPTGYAITPVTVHAAYDLNADG